jgi:hypothetical protein
MKEYRSIWIQHNGPIPCDNQGRSYEIHHINGNHSDNRIENLALVTLDEHYDIHYSQGDYGACNMIALRMKLSPAELSKKSSELMKQLAKEGRHPFQGKNVNISRVANGTHNFLGENNPSHRRVKEGKHNFQDKAWRSAKSKETQRKWLENKTHPNFIRVSCVICRHETNNPNLPRHIRKCNNEQLRKSIT